MKNIFNIFSNKKSNIPVTSSLDNQEVFSTILEYPPPVTIASTANSSKRLLLEQSLAEQQNKIDPISMSLARQSLDGRICYKNSPSKTPVPYCNNSSLFLGHFDKNNSSTIVIEEEEDSDEDRKMMQRLSASSYQVW
ncbi:uncharacterized protein B0P05DRAFT_586019 [Gilbertella persicaria]|uniref:uncharacterized protein n=1 Tax=Gilbertella persicaria TaxID=101096 RepID=UPI0022200283|nr:uncharacterized protein B0P05DRAFT_586019 [Gilbertella persicaria]KAI8083269.1 hypothetical protein B0P05DRAFT_586019 [Gilbertella persicaria]